ncbi:MAG: NBR1-Ig-like domain-containing protein [Anaerolineales bacterium]
MIKRRLMYILGMIVISTMALTACGGEAPTETTPTADLNFIRTQAVQTFSADLTLTATLAPTNTATATATVAPTFPALATTTGGTPLATQSTGGGTGTSCYGMTYVSDVTIPDNTQMNPGQSFTKTWKIQNSGTCAWDAGFKFAYSSGNAMGGTTYTFPSAVAAGAVVDVSVAMTAPTTAGKAQGNWRMATANGTPFGNEVYVLINVGGAGAGATATTGASVTNTPATPSATTQTSP